MTPDAYLTALGAVLSILGGVWWIVTHKTNELERRMDMMENHLDTLDERIFLLATGKTLREAMLESKQKKEK